MPALVFIVVVLLVLTSPGTDAAGERGDCSLRVMRGGSLVSDPGSLRSAYRLGYTTGGTFGIGIRLARTISP